MDRLDFTGTRRFTGVNYDTFISQSIAPCGGHQTQNRNAANAACPPVGRHCWRCRAPQAPEDERRWKAKNCRSSQSAVGESQGAEVNRQASQKGPTKNECGGEGKNCGGSQGTLEKSEGGREDKAVADYEAHTPSGHDWNSV